MKKSVVIILALALIVGAVLLIQQNKGEKLPVNDDASSSMISSLGMAQVVLAQASENTDTPVVAGNITEETVVSDILTNEDAYQGAYGLFQQQLGYDQETMDAFWAELTAKGEEATVADWVAVLNTWYLEPATDEYIESLGSDSEPVDLPEGTPADSQLAGTWVWEETVMNNDETTTPNNPGDFTITFTDEGVYGTTDCNNFNGSYELDMDEASISFGPLAMTKKACMESQEMDFVADFTEVSGYFVTDEGKLALLLPYDSGSMVFAPVAVEE